MTGASLLLGLPESASSQTNNVHVTTIADRRGDTFELSNGAVFEKTSYGYVAYIGFQPDALLFSRRGEARLWIEDHGVMGGDLIRAPRTRANAEGSLVDVMQVRGNGEFLQLLAGSLLEVDPVDVVTTMVWIGPFEAILLSDGRLFNLDEGSDVIRIVAVR